MQSPQSSTFNWGTGNKLYHEVNYDDLLSSLCYCQWYCVSNTTIYYDNDYRDNDDDYDENNNGDNIKEQESDDDKDDDDDDARRLGGSDLEILGH